MYKLVEGKDFALKGGRPGYIYKDSKGNSTWVEIDLKTFPQKELAKLIDDYQKRSGPEKIERELQTRSQQQTRPTPSSTSERPAERPPTPQQPATPPSATTSPEGTQRPSTPPQTPQRPATPPSATTPSATPQRPPATPSTSDKIRTGLERYRQQIKSGDIKGAEETGRSTWALANPKLAAAAAERERIRGTAQSDNPLLDKMGLRSGMRAGSPTVQSPTLQKDLGNVSSRYTSLTQNPNVIGTPKPVTQTATTPSSIKTDTAAQRIQSIQTRPSSTQPTPFSTRRMSSNLGTTNGTIRSHYEYDSYDIILEYLISKGHAEDLNEANYIMLEMDSDSIANIIEEYNDFLLSEEISDWVDNLLNEGYDLSNYTWDEIVEYYVTESNYGTAKGRKKTC